jgi:outer membrane protein
LQNDRRAGRLPELEDGGSRVPQEKGTVVAMRKSSTAKSAGRARSGRWVVSAFVLFLLGGIVAISPAQQQVLSIADATHRALEKNPGVESANWDRLAASAKADAARYRLFPSLSLSAGYQRLSEVPATSVDFPNPSPPPATIALELPASLNNVFSFGASLQYPVFAGYRLREALAAARLSAEGKEASLETLKRSLIFEVRRSYWEALRAGNNVLTLQRNLELARSNYRLLADQVASGAATQADLLAADARRKQAEIDLGGAVVLKKRAYLLLASQIGMDVANLDVRPDPSDTRMPFALSTQPEEALHSEIAGSLDEQALIQTALARRPETRGSEIAAQAAEHSARLAAAPLYPTVAITGNYTLADPNQRVAFQIDPWQFTGTWSLGLQLSYDLGGVAANLKEKEAQELGVSKSRADAANLRDTIVLDVRGCVLSLTRARADLELVRQMVAQAEENARVAAERFEAGTLNEVGNLGADLALLQAQFAVANKQIDVQIAAADLLRATAIEDLP